MSFTWARELDEYPTGSKRRKILAMAVLASLVCSYEGAIAPVVPLLLPDLGLKLSTYGLLSAGAALAGAVAGLIGGRFADKYGRVRVLIPLMSLTAFLAFTMVLVTNTTQLIIVRVILSFVEGIAVAATAPLVRDFSPRMGRAQGFGFWTWGPVGANFISAGIAAATLPLFNNSWHSQFVIIGALSLVASIVIALNIADLSPALRAEVLQTERTVIEVVTEEAPPAKPSALLKSPTVWAHCAGIATWLVFYLTVVVYGQTMIAQTFDKTAAQASLIMMMFWVLNIAVVVLAGRWSDKLQLRKIFALTGTIASLVMLVIFIMLMGNAATPTGVLMLVGSLLGATLGFAYSPWMANYSENSEDIDPRLQGMTWGLFNFVVKFVAMLVVIGAPLVVESTGSWRPWIIISAICVAVFCLVIPLFKGPWLRRDVVTPEVIGTTDETPESLSKAHV